MMKISYYGDYLIQLTRLGAFNCYLVQEEAGLTLIDTGLSGSAKDILATAVSLGKPITRVTLTHAHGDHAGSLDAICAQLPEAEIAWHPRTASFLGGDLSLKADEPQAKLRGSFISATTQAARELLPGDKLGSLRVVAAPGHTPDQIAFFDERDGSLIAGDAFQTKAGTAVAGQMRWLFPFPALATWHKPTALQSAYRLRDLQPTRLAVGHGRVLENPRTALDAAIRAAEEALDGQKQAT